MLLYFLQSIWLTHTNTLRSIYFQWRCLLTHTDYALSRRNMFIMHLRPQPSGWASGAQHNILDYTVQSQATCGGQPVIQEMLHTLFSPNILKTKLFFNIFQLPRNLQLNTHFFLFLSLIRLSFFSWPENEARNVNLSFFLSPN